MAKEKHWLILIVLLGLGIRLITLNQSFWLDETAQAVMSSRNLNFIWSGRAGDFQPPLFYILAHYWMDIAKSDQFLRILPLSFGLLGIIAIFFLSLNLGFDKKTSLLSSLFLALNQYHIFYSQEFRMYSLVVLLTIMATVSLLKNQKLYFLWTCLMWYTHYTTVLFTIAQLIYVGIFKRKDLKFILISNFLAFLIYLPWIPQLVDQIRNSTLALSTYIGWKDLLSFNSMRFISMLIPKLIGGRISFYPKYLYYIYSLVATGMVAYSFIKLKQNKTLIVGLSLFPVVLMLLISFLAPMNQVFRIIYILPFIIIPLAALASKNNFILVLTLLIFMFSNLVYLLNKQNQREQWKQAINFLRDQNTQVMNSISDKWAPFYWYASDLTVTNDPTSRNVFYVDYLESLTDPNQQKKKMIESLGYRPIKEYSFEGVGKITKYQL